MIGKAYGSYFRGHNDRNLGISSNDFRADGMYDHLEAFAISCLSHTDFDDTLTIIDDGDASFALSVCGNMHTTFARIHSLCIVTDLEVSIALSDHMQMPMLFVWYRLVNARLGSTEVEVLSLLDRVRLRIWIMEDVRRVAIYN